MLYREIISVCSEIHTKHINTVCGQNVELLNVKLVVNEIVNLSLRTFIRPYIETKVPAALVLPAFLTIPLGLPIGYAAKGNKLEDDSAVRTVKVERPTHFASATSCAGETNFVSLTRFKTNCKE